MSTRRWYEWRMALSFHPVAGLEPSVPLARHILLANRLRKSQLLQNVDLVGAASALLTPQLALAGRRW
ncbi:unnamed protein product [Echinostoma caproni]|uniref:Glycosyl transferase n=1 Tax=Echinostoma caproni TaxID=27848 RepID=A0A183ANT8_9TREM|nr:unnamed protein product [Echinostoma caproni]